MQDRSPKAPTRPGLAKARDLPLFQRGGERVRAVDAPWRALLDRADVMSEGDTKSETDGPVWYGTTSMLVTVGATEEERIFFAALAERDLHVRTRAIRAAFREAQSRAQGALGKMTAEFRVSVAPCGLRIDVEVQAPLIERRRQKRSPPGG